MADAVSAIVPISLDFILILPRFTIVQKRPNLGPVQKLHISNHFTLVRFL